jgi:hypothetical protein
MRMTTKEMEDDMSAVDMELLMNMWDLLLELEQNRLTQAVNRGLVGDK